MQITHEQAHRLIQRSMDNLLNTQDSATLFEHLRNCIDCQSYKNEMNEVETLLVPVLKRQWNIQPIPFPLDTLMGRSTKTQPSVLLTMRKAAIGLVVVMLFFSAWQFVNLGPLAPGPIAQDVPPVPTPSVQTARFTSTTDTCEMILYTIQGNDTLASIAERFSMPEEEIIAANHLEMEVIGNSMQLVIPICNFTPTGTVHPATFTTTYTPLTKPITSTPGG